MYGLVGVTPTAQVLPIAVAFSGVMVCFAGWVRDDPIAAA